MKTFKLDTLSLAIASTLLALAGVAQAQVVINDTLTGASSSFDWAIPNPTNNGACLTAGTSFTIVPPPSASAASAPTANTIPACSVGGKNLTYYTGKTLVGGATGTLPDAIGQGALRLTNGDTTTGTNGNNQTGAIVSNFTFPTNEGLQVTWTSVTYGGNAYKNNHSATNSDGTTYNNLSGADGISFFLSDGGTTTTPIAPTIGALGGSLGYSCSNVNGTYDGVNYGYIGIGMDEFGNFSNSGDNTSSGSTSGQTPGAIVVRGAGHTNWKWLSTNYPAYYPDGTHGVTALSAADQATAVKTTCKTGKLYNYSGGDISVTVPKNYTANYTYTKGNGTVVAGTITSSGSAAFPASGKCDNDGTLDSGGNRTCTYTNQVPSTATTNQTVSTGTQIPSNVVGSAYQLDYNYPYLSGSTFPTGSYIFNQEAQKTSLRGSAPKVTYSLLITQAGLLTFTYKINSGDPISVINGLDITASNGPLPKLFRFGFSSGTGGGSNVHEITCFKAAPANVSGSTAGSNVQSGSVQTDSQLYLAYYHPINSWGSLTAQNLVFTAGSGSTPGTLTVSSTVNWDAGCVLTGGPCQAQTTSSGSVPTVTALTDNTTRSILSWNGSTGIAFRWASSSLQTPLGSSDELDYLRGLQSKEVSNTGGTFRTRTSLLGDIVDSSPVWVGPPNFNYAAAWSDTLYPASNPPEGSSYAAFKTLYAGRTNVVYAGANDGMVHGFQAGAYVSGVFDKTNNNGKELLAYVPNQVVQTIKSANTNLDFSNTSYAHNFFVDAAPSQGDLFYNSNWHTWLVGGLGPGGQAGGPVADNTTPETGTVYILDVTDPSKFSETLTSTVRAELSSTSLNVSNACTGISSGCGDSLGATYGTPLIRRLHDGTWGVIFGNGLNSKNGTAGVFIAHVKPSDGTIASVQFLDTGKKGSGKVLNGIVQPTPVDLDGDHIVDYIYAGDVLGNVWRFDLTSSTATDWKVKSTPLMTTQSGQPITSGIAVDAVTTVSDAGAAASQPRIIVAFGTGQKLPRTLTGDSVYPTTQQSIYGIWDADMATWNANSNVATQFQYASLTNATNSTVPAIVPGTGGAGNLLLHTITTANGVRSTDTKQYVCWYGSTACTGGTGSNTQMGWELDLTLTPASGSTPAVAEQVLFSPLVASHFFNTNTDIPTLAQALTCDSSSDQAFSMGISMATGGAGAGIPGTSTTYTYFTGTPVGTIGVGTQATGTSSLVSASDGSQWLVFQKTDGSGGTLGVDPPPAPPTGKAARQTWTKMR